MDKRFEDLVYFGRIISSALLICGFVVLGLIIGQKLVERGYPNWVILLCALLGALFGLWQAWLWIKKLIKRS